MAPYDPASDHYMVLGVPPTATADEVKRVFRDKVQLVHPDGHRAPELATREMQRLNAAYDVLGDPARRAAYDQQRDAYLRRAQATRESTRTRAAAPAPARSRTKTKAKAKPKPKPKARSRTAARPATIFDLFADAWAADTAMLDALFSAPPRRRRTR